MSPITLPAYFVPTDPPASYDSLFGVLDPFPPTLGWVSEPPCLPPPYSESDSLPAAVQRRHRNCRSHSRGRRTMIVGLNDEIRRMTFD